MYRTSIILFLVLFLTCTVAAQSYNDLFKDLRKIKLLESTRDDVKQILYLYEAELDGHSETFSKDDVEIEVYYSSGNCSDEPDEDDASEIWKVGEWKVTRIEVSADEPIKVGDAGFDLSKLTKEQLYSNTPDRHVYHDKSRGLFLKVEEDGIDEIVLFPRKASAKKLCSENETTKELYARESWFEEKLEDRVGGCINLVANVVGLDLSKDVLEATSTKRVDVTTTATDPENDVLTYNYKVTAGKIRGVGAKVVWDLTGVPAGTHTITAGVDDGCGICGATKTLTVVVK